MSRVSAQVLMSMKSLSHRVRATEKHGGQARDESTMCLASLAPTSTLSNPSISRHSSGDSSSPLSDAGPLPSRLAASPPSVPPSSKGLRYSLSHDEYEPEAPEMPSPSAHLLPVSPSAPPAAKLSWGPSRCMHTRRICASHEGSTGPFTWRAISLRQLSELEQSEVPCDQV